MREAEIDVEKVLESESEFVEDGVAVMDTGSKTEAVNVGVALIDVLPEPDLLFVRLDETV